MEILTLFFVDNGSGFVGVFTPASAVLVDTWQHVAGTWNGSMMRIYVDGVELGSNLCREPTLMQAVPMIYG